MIKETSIKIIAEKMLPIILSLTMNIPDNELIIQWNNTHNQTLLKILLIIAKAKLNPSIFIPKAK